MSEMPAHLRPAIETDGNHLIATYGNHHYIFEEPTAGVLTYAYTETDDGDRSHYKPRKNVLAYLRDLGYEIQ